jgi:MSHA biogenesis protein MshN
MSLINQMLCDLESRRASGAERAALPDQVRVLARETRINWPWILLTTIVAVTVIGAAGWLAVDPAAATLTAFAPQSDAASRAPAEPVPTLGVPSSGRAAADATRAEPAKAPFVPRAEPDVAGRPQAPAHVRPPIATSTVIAREVSAQTAPRSAIVAAKTVAVVAIAEAKPAPAVAKPHEVDLEPTARPAAARPQIDKRAQQLTPLQLAENAYREAASLLHQGMLVEAQEQFRLALQHNPAHAGARQGLFGVLLDAKKSAEAEQVLREGLEMNPAQPGFAMALARLRVDRGDATGAIDVLQKTLPAALGSPDYLAFLAALMQRQSRHQEAVDNFRAALRLAPDSGVWLMGLGISLQALNRGREAQDAFRRARNSNTLTPELLAFVDQRMKQAQ